EKSLVFFDRSADGEAKLVPLEGRLSVSVRVVLPCGRVENTIAEKLIDRSVELVRSGLGDHVHDASDSSAELGAVVGGQHLKLADSVNAQESTARAARRSEKGVAVDIHAVE